MNPRVLSLKDYCSSLTRYSRYETREVQIGNVPLGGKNPIRIQSMTTTDTMDTLATVEQSIRMIEAGCEYVRITAPSINEAKNLELIKKELRSRGYETPLVADIHFTPNAAEYAARVVEKVRVNPGNYADKKKFENIEYSDSSYSEELERIRNRFVPLINICKEYGTAMRIGTNHGSLSDRIMSRYGDTPLGMVESALEFVRICEENNYHQLVLSMKSSNPQVMVQAYRLLVLKMQEEGMNYPLHLGVTEAGEGEDGRIKSAEGIGTLLEDGLGDTVRVSLTEEPEFELPVARTLVSRYTHREKHSDIPEIEFLPYSPLEFKKRNSNNFLSIGGTNPGRVVCDLSELEKITPASFSQAGYNYSVELDKWNITDQAADFIFVGNKKVNFQIPGTLSIITTDHKQCSNERTYFLSTFIEAEAINFKDVSFIEISAEEIFEEDLTNLPQDCILVLTTSNAHAMPALRRAFIQLEEKRKKNPVIVLRDYHLTDPESTTLFASTDLGGLLLDGFSDGVWLRSSTCSPRILNGLSFGILQAARNRISKTEYISCPSCGRTLFDLQQTTARIRKVTDHLKGIKIGIMGCIVNGPGEMADADYGYVGTGIGKITLYKGREVVKRNIPSEEAVDALIDLIKENGDWVERK